MSLDTRLMFGPQSDSCSYNRLRRVDRTGRGHKPFDGVTGTGESLTDPDRVLPSRPRPCRGPCAARNAPAKCGRLRCDPQFACLAGPSGCNRRSNSGSRRVLCRAQQRSLRVILYIRAVLVAATTLRVGVGLIRSR